MLEQEPKSKIIFRIMRDKIARNEWPPGTKLSSFDVAKQLKTGRTTVNDAIKMLEKNEFIEIQLNVGFQVKTYENILLEEDLEIRKNLEKLAIQFILRKSCGEELAEGLHFLKLADAGFSIQAYQSCITNMENFRKKLYQLTGSRYLENILLDSWERQMWYLEKILYYNQYTIIHELYNMDMALTNTLTQNNQEKAIYVLVDRYRFLKNHMSRIILEESKE